MSNSSSPLGFPLPEQLVNLRLVGLPFAGGDATWVPSWNSCAPRMLRHQRRSQPHGSVSSTRAVLALWSARSPRRRQAKTTVAFVRKNPVSAGVCRFLTETNDVSFASFSGESVIVARSRHLSSRWFTRSADGASLRPEVRRCVAGYSDQRPSVFQRSWVGFAVYFGCVAGWLRCCDRASGIGQGE